MIFLLLCAIVLSAYAIVIAHNLRNLHHKTVENVQKQIDVLWEYNNLVIEVIQKYHEHE